MGTQMMTLIIRTFNLTLTTTVILPVPCQTEVNPSNTTLLSTDMIMMKNMERLMITVRRMKRIFMIAFTMLITARPRMKACIMGILITRWRSTLCHTTYLIIMRRCFTLYLSIMSQGIMSLSNLLTLQCTHITRKCNLIRLSSNLNMMQLLNLDSTKLKLSIVKHRSMTHTNIKNYLRVETMGISCKCTHMRQVMNTNLSKQHTRTNRMLTLKPITHSSLRFITNPSSSLAILSCTTHQPVLQLKIFL